MRAGSLALTLATTLAATGTLVGCNQKNQDFRDKVRDVRPITLERHGTMVVEAAASRPGLEYVVVLNGRWRVPEKDGWETRKLEVYGRGAAGDRVLVNVDELEERLGGHRRFQGQVSVELAGDAPRKVVAKPLYTRLNFFPLSLRQSAYNLVEDGVEVAGLRLLPGREGKFTDYLGARLYMARDKQSKKPIGITVADLRQAFDGQEFMGRYDCGNYQQGWVNDAKNPPPLPVDGEGKPHKDFICQGTLDNIVAFDEARVLGFDAELFMKVSGGSRYIDRHTAEAYTRKAGKLAAAGLKKGDVIVRVCGSKPSPMDPAVPCEPGEGTKDVRSVADLAAVWRNADEAQVYVEAQRGAATVTVPLGTFGAPAELPVGFLLAGVLMAAGLLVLLPVGPGAGLIVVWERKVAGRMQSRFGPNRVGPGGWLQWLADGVKLIVKEDVIPTDADPLLFRASPYLVFMGLFAVFVVLPFSQSMIIADLDIGLLYLMSVTSLVVVGIIMGGWSSNSKWSLLGGMRSAAQIISYELPAGLAMLSVVVIAGTLSPQTLVANQGGSPWHWFVFDNPMTFTCFFIWFISALAEGNRTPFDLPEAESELVSGYNTEYSGFRFSIFFLTEWTNLFVIGAIATTVFFGGWRIPGVHPDTMETSFFWQAAGFAMMMFKSLVFVFIVIWIRWTLPRFRVDQMMNMCWKYFVPITLASLILVAGYQWVTPTNIREYVRYAMFAVFGVGLGGFFVSRVIFTYKSTKKTLRLT